MIKEWQWIEREEALKIHEMQIDRYGGAAGIRDEGMLESALGRPKNLHAYEGIDDPIKLAASYGFGLARNHPFVDGNKRAAFVIAAFFLRLSGFKLVASQSDVVRVILGLAEGTVSEDEFAEWLRGATAPVEG